MREIENNKQKCSCCKIFKPFDEFHKCSATKYKIKNICKDCIKTKSLEYTERNKQIINKRKNQYYKNNKQKYKEYYKEYYQENKEKIKTRIKQNKEKDREKTLEQNRKSYKKRYKEYIKNPSFRINQSIKSGIIISLKNTKKRKNGKHWEDLVGYTIEDLMNHLENQFQEGMSWENYGEWHIDHIIPKSWFIFESYEDEDFKKCWALENLQPLWAKDNISKGNRFSN